MILAAIQYLRSVEKEGHTQPRELRRLIVETKKWKKKTVKSWNVSLYISRMLQGNPTSGGAPLLEFPRRRPRRNGYVVLTEAGRDHLDRLSLSR